MMLNDLLYRFRAMFHRRAVEQELDDELQFHLEQEQAKYANAGTPPDEAKRLARLALQGPEQAKERCRDTRGTQFWDATVQDLRYTIRQFRAAPGFAVIASLILALGIGANTAIFSLLDAVMLQSLPVRDPQQLVVPRWTAKEGLKSSGYDSFDSCFASKRPGAKVGGCSFSYPLYTLIASKHDLFSNSTALAGPMHFNVNANGSAASVAGSIVSGTFFRTLGLAAALGRTFTEDDDTLKASPAIVISYGYWQKAFGGDATVLGKSIRVNGMPFAVIGVAARGFNRLSPGRDCDFWIPIHPSTRLEIAWISDSLGNSQEFWLEIIGRLQPGITADRAQAELNALFVNEIVYHAKLLKPTSDPLVEIAPAHKALIGIRQMLAKPIYILMCAVCLILLIACANVAGLMTARAAARQREISIRLAVGAARSRIIRQLLTESIVIAALGGLAGLAIALWGTPFLTRFVWWGHLDVKPDLRILLFTTAVSIASGISFGLIPAIRSTRTGDFSPSERSAGLHQGMSAAARRRWFSKSLVVAQVALAVVLLVSGGLFVRTLVNLKTLNPGFNPNNLLLFGIDPVSLHYNEAQIQTLYRNLRERLVSLPGVTGVTYSESPLLAGSLHGTDLQIEGWRDQRRVPVNILPVGPDFFRIMGISMVSGRPFASADFANKRPVAIINQAFVKQYFEGRNPLGLHIGQDPPKVPGNQIVGVVGDVKYSNLRDEIKPTAYIPLRVNSAHFELRIATDPSTLTSAVQKIVHEVDPNLPVFDVQTQTGSIDKTLVVERLVADLSAAFALLALTLACIGLYGLLSYEVAQRTREIGVRMAVGAAPSVIQRAVLLETVGIVVIGLVIGIPAALAAARAISAMLYGVQSNDRSTVLLITSTLIIVAGFAGYLPARRASLVDPMVALRSE